MPDYNGAVIAQTEPGSYEIMRQNRAAVLLQVLRQYEELSVAGERLDINTILTPEGFLKEISEYSNSILLGKYDRSRSVEEICSQIEQAYTLALVGSGMISDDNVYQGNAGEELYFFLASAVGHTQKLMMLYGAAQTYLSNTFQEMCDEDELLVWAIDHIIT